MVLLIQSIIRLLLILLVCEPNTLLYSLDYVLALSNHFGLKVDILLSF